MTRTLPSTVAAFAALLLVAMTWLPTVSTAPASTHFAGTIPVVSLA